MFIRPDIISVLELARDIIRNEFNEEYSSDIKYKTLMTASAINIATRQLTVDTESIKTVTKELYTITYSDQFNANDPDPSYQKITRKLCNDIRQGKYDPGTSNSDRLLKVLTEIVDLQVDIYSPAIALRFAKEGANIVIAAKTAKPHPKLPGTIFDAAKEVESAGGTALPIRTDIRDENQISDAVNQAVETFGSIDALVNNASAISLTGTLETPMKKFDLMFGVNVRGTYAVSQACLPYLLKSNNPHILNIASPVNLNPRWFQGHTAYTMAKYGMSMCVIGMSEEFKKDGLAVNALWPKTIIDTAALRLVPGIDSEASRDPNIMADAAYSILTKDSKTCSGNFFLDEEVLRSDGVTDFSNYMVNPNKIPTPDLFLD